MQTFFSKIIIVPFINVKEVAIYSIKDLEKLTGVKAHTIRIWEQRYKLITPGRTKTNIRYYDDAALKHLLNIVLLNKNGLKISKIATMSENEISEQVALIADADTQYDTQIDALTLAMIEMDEVKFDRIFSNSIEHVGLEQTMMQLVFPLLDRLTLLWLTGSVTAVKEHFMSYLLRQKVITSIDREPLVTGRDVRKFMIYLPEGERQELSLLFMHYLLKVRRNQVIYLGQEIGLDDLRDACHMHTPDFVFTLINEPFFKLSVQEYVDNLSQLFPQSQVLLSGYQVVTKDISVPENITILKSLEDTINFIDDLRLHQNRRISHDN